MYQFTAVYQSKDNPENFFTPTITAFTKKDLNLQTMLKLPKGFRFVRIVQTVAGKVTHLFPKAPDFERNQGGPDPDTAE